MAVPILGKFHHYYSWRHLAIPRLSTKESTFVVDHQLLELEQIASADKDKEAGSCYSAGRGREICGSLYSCSCFHKQGEKSYGLGLIHCE